MTAQSRQRLEHRPKLGNHPAAEVAPAEVLLAEVLHVETAAAVSKREVADRAGARSAADRARAGFVVGHGAFGEAAEAPV